MSKTITGTGASGGRIVRGPMAGDHYTKIHNLAVRGAIHTRYVGVFGFISSHQQGWTLTVASVAKALGVGVDFVAAALKNIEKAHCLIRDRDRDAAGKLGGAVWFVTDLPLQLRQLGVDDDEMIAAQVRTAYERWQAEQASAAEPEPENPILDLTCANTDNGEGSPRSEPKLGFPSLAEPSLADPVHKKTMGEEDQDLSEDDEENSDSSPLITSVTTARRAAPRGGGGAPEIPTEIQAQLAEVVAEVTARRRAWTVKAVTAALTAAIVDDGRDPAEAATAMLELADDVRGTLLPSRIRQDAWWALRERQIAAGAAPDAPGTASPAAQPVPWCGGCPKSSRMVTAGSLDPHAADPRAAVPCPTCGPTADRPAA